MWQQINGPWQFCHWWQDQCEGRITAMFTVLIVLLVIAAGIVLARAIPQDGYGTRPGPRSHIDPFEPRSRIV
jgi:hypothetical protein